jgi:hypothetical protein
MPTLHTPEATNNFNTTHYTDDVFRRLVDAGFTVREIERAAAAELYRLEYNSRPDVKAKRAVYNAKRAERMKQLKALLK